MKSYLFMSIGFIALMIMAACSPNTTPASPPSPALPAPVSAPTSNLSPVRQAQGEPPTSQNAAWEKVVEAARKEGQVTVYSYNLTGDIGLAMSRAFKDRYGIHVDIITGKGAEFIQRLRTEKRIGGIVGDVMDNNPANVKLLKAEGLTAGVADELAALHDKNIWVADIVGLDPVDKHLIGFNFTTYGAWINTNLVKPGEEPKEWKDYLDPKWKGKMLATNPTTSAGLLNLFIPLLREKVVDEEYIKALYKQDLRFSSNYPDDAALLSRGERAITFSATDSVYSQFIAQGAPIKNIDRDGTVMSLTVVSAINGGPHPNAAKVFINWFISPEGQTVWCKAASVGSVRKDVTDFRPEAGRIKPKRPVLTTNEDADEAAKLFQQQWLNKLWGRQ